MTIELYLKPFELAEEVNSSSICSVGTQLDSYTPDLDLSDYSVALLSVPESRGTEDGELSSEAIINIRKELFTLKNSKWSKRMLDLGELVSGLTLEDTKERLVEVVYFLLEKKVKPVLLLGSKCLLGSVSEAFRRLKKPYSLTNIAADMALEENGGKSPDETYLNSILQQEPNYLFSYSHLAYQSYFVNSEIIDMLGRWSYEKIRLGQLREDFEQAEPILRGTGLVAFDVESMGNTSFSSSVNPFGLTGEEACKLSNYTGLSDELKCFCITGLSKIQDNGVDQRLISTVLWYFLDGLNCVNSNKEERLKNSQKFIVSISEKKDSLIFYKEKLTGKWWMEIEWTEKLGVKHKELVACSYQDYIEATEGSLPQRWMMYSER